MTFFDHTQLVADTFVRHVEYHEEIPSTNTRAAGLAADANSPTPLLVLARRQTAGRGRGANRWWSAEGALTFSLIIEAATLNLKQDRWPRVSLAAGVAVCETLQTLLPANRVGLKWPNDVHLDGRKTCGILVETAPRSGRLVVGIGLNVNNSLAGAPDDVRARATSLVDAGGVEFDTMAVLAAVLLRIEKNLYLISAAEQQLALSWQALSVLTGRKVTLDLGQRQVAGVCHGIDCEGALVLQTAAGSERFFAGVVANW